MGQNLNQSERASVKVLKEAIELQNRKSQDYQNPLSRVRQADHYPRGIEDTKERLNNREEKYKYVVHAEMNAIFNACLNGTSLDGSTLFVYGLPVCSECAKGIIQVGVKHVAFLAEEDIPPGWTESWERTRKMFEEAGVTYDCVSLNYYDVQQ